LRGELLGDLCGLGEGVGDPELEDVEGCREGQVVDSGSVAVALGEPLDDRCDGARDAFAGLAACCGSIVPRPCRRRARARVATAAVVSRVRTMLVTTQGISN
jgi:hypothetical protein